jgi:hypothetical protein
MTEVRTGIPESQLQKAKVIDIQAARRERLPEGRQGQEAKIQPETLPKEREKEPAVAAFPTEKPISPEIEQTRRLNEETDTRKGLAQVRQKLREEQEKGEGEAPLTGETAVSAPNVRDIQQREWFEGKRDAPPGKMKVALDKDTYTFIDTPEEKTRKRETIPQDERQQLTEVVSAYGSRPLTEDEWKVVEGSHNLKDFFDTLEDSERSKFGHKQELLQQGMNERFGKILKERAQGYPDWWKVYDKDGNRIFKMSLMDKALLAKWQEFDNQSPDEKLEILKEWAEKHILKDKEKSAGEKFAKLLDDLFDFLIALASPNREAENNNERNAHKAA